MANRSCINLSGNATQGLCVGSGTTVYKGKSNGVTLDFKSLSSLDDTSLAITCADNNIFLSAATGGGGDLELNSVSIVTAASVDITSWVINHPA